MLTGAVASLEAAAPLQMLVVRRAMIRPREAIPYPVLLEQMELNAKFTCPTCGKVHEYTFPYPPKATVPPASAP